jgi:hypothetical protein
MQPFTSVPRMLLARRSRWPARVDNAPKPLPERDAAMAVVAYIGHATLLMQAQAGNILTDPMRAADDPCSGSRRNGPSWLRQ